MQSEAAQLSVGVRWDEEQHLQVYEENRGHSQTNMLDFFIVGCGCRWTANGPMDTWQNNENLVLITLKGKSKHDGKENFIATRLIQVLRPDTHLSSWSKIFCMLAQVANRHVKVKWTVALRGVSAMSVQGNTPLCVLSCPAPCVSDNSL